MKYFHGLLGDVKMLLVVFFSAREAFPDTKSAGLAANIRVRATKARWRLLWPVINI